jgi:flagellar biosynthesis protein FliQ
MQAKYPGPNAMLATHAMHRQHSRKGVIMSLDIATELIRQTLMMALIVSAPMLVIGLLVGVIVSLLQAVTQIQEQSLSFVPKIVAMVASAIVLMPWIGHRVMEYATVMFSLQ